MSEERLNYYKEWVKDNEEIVVDSSIFEELVNEIEQLKSIIKEVREYIEERYQVKGTMVYDSPIYHKDILEILDKVGDYNE